MPRWEYRVLFYANEEVNDLQADLNVFGEDGWELVGVSAMGQQVDGRTAKPKREFDVVELVVVLKRPMA